MQRTLLGILALILLACAAALWWSGSTDPLTQQYMAACVRGGVLVAVLWLALPQTRTPANRVGLAIVFALVVVLIAKPKALLILLSPPVLIGLGTLGGILTVLRRMAPRRATTPRKRRPPDQPGASR